MLKIAAKPQSATGGSHKVVQLALPRFARPEEHFETLGSSKKKGGD